MNDRSAQLSAAIAALEGQRATLGDAVVETALAPLRRELAELGSHRSTPRQQLKQVTVLFVDVVGSTAMGQRLEPEEISAVMDGALERFTATVRAHHGRVLQYTGDGMLAAFGAEEANEGDVESAVRAGLAIIEDAKAQSDDVRRRHGLTDFAVRAGLHTGTVLLGGGVDADSSIRGATVNVAARMEQSAPPGRLRISHDSYRHVRGLFEFSEPALIQVKGVEQPLRTYLVERAKPRAFRVASRRHRGRAHEHGRPRGRARGGLLDLRRHRASSGRRARSRSSARPGSARAGCWPSSSRRSISTPAGCCWAAPIRAARCTRTACCATCCAATCQSAESDSDEVGAPEADRRACRRSFARRARRRST